MKRKTIEQFIKEAKTVHGDKYDYSKAVYTNNNDKICIICPEHGEFWQKPKDHLKGRGCPKCGRIRTNQSKVLSTEEFIIRAKNKHGDKYNYNKTVYKSFKENVIVTCPIHGDFEINPHNHISNGSGCPICAKFAKGPTRLSTDEFINKAKIIHRDLYDYSNVEYIKSNEKVCIICPKHGEFWMTPNKHLIGQHCPKCAQTKGEYFIYNLLNTINIEFKTQYIIRFNNSLRNYFKIDFAINKNNKIYLIEYNGVQHYTPNEYFGGLLQFEKQQLRDSLLREFIKDNLDKYELLEIDYRYNKYTIIKKILNFLEVPISGDINSKLGELLEDWNVNQQPSLELTIEEGSETNTWNCNTEYNSDTSAQHLKIDDDIVRTKTKNKF